MPFVFKVDLNVINHLGVGLYSSTPAALTELVANAWDADATTVTITVDPGAESITIEDDGHGMNADTLQNKFLNVGYSRRKLSKHREKSDSGARYVMGRKGIGKLAMFALAEDLEISSKTAVDPSVGVKINVPLFRKSLENGKTLALVGIKPKPFPSGHGTRIHLTNVLKGLNTTEPFLRMKLARRFSVIDDEAGFKIILNKREITRTDRGFYEAVQFLWTFDRATLKSIITLTPNLASLQNDKSPSKTIRCTEVLPNSVGDASQKLRITGYIASVVKPRDLGAKEDSANVISIFANGRVFAENVLPELSNAMYYQNYLVGEIHADFLDRDSTDRATASREAIKKDDPLYQALLSTLKSALQDIGHTWDEWRSALGLDKKDSSNATVLEWLDTLTDKRDRKTAERLMTGIKNAQMHPDEQKNTEAQNTLYRGAIVAFEKLRLRKQLSKLDSVESVLSPEFAAIFATLDSVEEASYAEITRQRLAIVDRFAEIADDPDALEKVAQKYLFDHLWLLDPTWDRVSGQAEMEKTLTKYLKKKVQDTSGARLDISYRASTGRHVVVELKKPSLKNLAFTTLYEQVRRYKIAVGEFYRTEYPNSEAPALDIYVLISRSPQEFGEDDKKSLFAQSGKIITYSELISNARKSYQEYLAAIDSVSPIDLILQRLS